jgi:hypothetical protein
MSVDFVPVLSSGVPLYVRLNESTETESSCSTSEHVPLIGFFKFPTPVWKMRGILPTWQKVVESTWMLVQEGDGESVSRDLRIDQVLERGDRGGGMIDMLRKESVISESVVGIRAASVLRRPGPGRTVVVAGVAGVKGGPETE